MDFGSKVKNIRYSNGISQEEMAKILKINRNCLSRIETNKSLPNADTLYRLAKNFNVSIDTLLGTNRENRNNDSSKKNKIKKITQYCSYLSNEELDFVINVLYVMSTNEKIKL